MADPLVDGDGELAQAVKRARERKIAAGVQKDEVSGEEVTRRVLSGLDLDLQELMSFQRNSYKLAIEAASNGVPLHLIVGGLHVDGIVIGMLIMQERQQKEAQERMKQNG